MLFTLENRELFKCSKEERESLVPYVEFIVNMARKARRLGILGLESTLNEIDEPRLRLGMQMVVDGMESELIVEILETQTVASGKTGVGLLRQAIAIQGAMSLQAGEDWRIVEMKLLAYLGDDVALCNLPRTKFDTYEFTGILSQEEVDLLLSVPKPSREAKLNALKECSINELELLAVEIYRDSNCKKKLSADIRNILSERAIKMNKTFEWTNENKQKLLHINEKIMQASDNAYREALSAVKKLKDRIKNNDDFIKDYEVEIRVTPYLKDCVYDDDANEKSIGQVLSEPDLHSAPIRFSVWCYKLEHDIPLHCDKSSNWNIEYFGDVFKDDYICYGIHELLDKHWSFSDIINIDRLWADVVVTHQYFENI